MDTRHTVTENYSCYRNGYTRYVVVYDKETHFINLLHVQSADLLNSNKDDKV